MLKRSIRQALIIILLLSSFSASVYSQTPVVIDVYETVTVSDTDETQKSEWIELSESVSVTDTVDISTVPVVTIDIAETVTVGDSIAALPSIMIAVNESVGVSDIIGTLLSVRIEITESVSITDEVAADALNIFAPSADAGSPYAETEGQPLLLDGTGSSDSDGNIVLYEWDVSNDGTYEYSSSSPTQSHIFAEQGNYSIRLRVTDDYGLNDEATAAAEIADSMPSADFTAEPLTGVAPLTVTFTNNSTGHDAPLTYVWDFDDDGTSDSTSTDPEYIYPEAGSYTVKLIARDSDDSTNSLTVTSYITVTGCSQALALVSGSTGTSYYDEIQIAYNSALESDTIKFQAEMFTENIDFNEDKLVYLESGYNCDYSVLTGTTTVNGNIIVSHGIVLVNNGVFKVQ